MNRQSHCRTHPKKNYFLKMFIIFVKTKINLKDLNIITNDQNDFENELFVKVRSTGRLIKAKIDINDTNAYVNLLEEEHGIAPGQACVFYSKNNNGYKVLGGGWIKS